MVAIAAARHTLVICSPYFLTDRSSRWAIDQAVRRGVHIRILTEGDRTDSRVVKYASRAKYDWLLSQGVDVFEYQPTMMHAKAIVVDGAWSMVGSANFDNRSFAFNEESNVSVCDRATVARLERIFADDFAASDAVTLEAWRRRGLAARGQELIAALFEDQV